MSTIIIIVDWLSWSKQANVSQASKARDWGDVWRSSLLLWSSNSRRTGHRVVIIIIVYTTSSWLCHGRCCHDVLKMTLKRDTWQVLLHGVVALTLYWVIQYRWQVTTLRLKSALFLQHLFMINFWAFLWPCLTQDKKGFPFAWRGSEPGDREKQWNLHPVLMITGSLILWLWLQAQCECHYHVCYAHNLAVNGQVNTVFVISKKSSKDLNPY